MNKRRVKNTLIKNYGVLFFCGGFVLWWVSETHYIFENKYYFILFYLFFLFTL